MFNAKKLICYGCAHSIGDGKYPSGPSGERPCLFCLRNKKREEWQKEFKKNHGREMKEWYNGTPIAKYPIDAYITLDMLPQLHDGQCMDACPTCIHKFECITQAKEN